jgi:hypothetical protein
MSSDTGLMEEKKAAPESRGPPIAERVLAVYWRARVRP